MLMWDKTRTSPISQVNGLNFELCTEYLPTHDTQVIIAEEFVMNICFGT